MHVHHQWTLQMRYLSVWLLSNLGSESHDKGLVLGMHNKTLY